jgi:hypothetical protein
MAASRATEREPISVGDIVEFNGFSWDVVGRREEPGLEGRPNVATLDLHRFEQQRLAPRFGQPNRFKKVARTAVVAERRCLLVGRQTNLFDALDEAPAQAPGASPFK